MFLFEKKIAYLGLYENGEKISSAGFVKIDENREGFSISVRVKTAGEKQESGPLFLLWEKGKVKIGMLTVNGGRGEYERSFSVLENRTVIGGEIISPAQIYGIRAELSGKIMIEGLWKDQPKKEQQEKEQPEKDQQEKEQPEKDQQEKEQPGKEKKKEDIKKAQLSYAETAPPAPEVFLGDKWEQLKRQYKNMHPFGDDRVYLSIEPKDFVVLSMPCQRLVNNSFLLHGFYNYRYVILGKDRQLGSGGETCFYIGVPGVFFEREKMVAVMFGFEGFECQGPVEIGKFGYYLRRVEL